MKVIIAGSRGINNPAVIGEAVQESGLEVTTVVHGAAVGVDMLADAWASRNRVDRVIFPANWDKYGKSAGARRNLEMAKYAEALIAVWDGKSRGTKHMIDAATELGLNVYVKRVDPKGE